MSGLPSGFFPENQAEPTLQFLQAAWFRTIPSSWCTCSALSKTAQK
jgi:hypothetical protein